MVILNEYYEEVAPMRAFVLLVIGLLIITTSMFAIAYLNDTLMTYAVVLLIVGFVFIAMIPFVPKTNGAKYLEVTINGEMSIKEIYEKYTVVERRGSIWVLEVKE